MAEQSKYAVAHHYYLVMVKRGAVDFAVGADWSPAAGDVKISIDGGAAANVTNLPTAIAMGNTAIWDFSLTSGEHTGKQIIVTVADSATKAVEDQSFRIETFGNASAQHPFDQDTATVVASSVTAVGTGAIVAGSFAAGAIDAPAIATDAIGSAELADSAITEIQTGIVTRRGTAQAGGASTITLDAGAVATDAYYVGQQVVITSGTGASQARLIHSYVGATKVATVGTAWATNPDNTSVFALLPNRVLVSLIITDAVDANALKADAVTEIQTGLATSAALATVQADTDDLQTRIPAALTGGRMDASVGAMANNVLTAAAIATDAIGAAELAADAVAEIVAGVMAGTNTTEVTADPGAIPTFSAAMQLLYQALRNKATDAAAASTIAKDDGTTVLTAVLADDGTTFTKNKFA